MKMLARIWAGLQAAYRASDMAKRAWDYPISQPPFEVIPFDDMTKDQARRHFDWFVSVIPERLALLRRTYANEVGRQDLDYTFESLVPFWVWIRRHAVRTGKKFRVLLKRPREAVGPPVFIEDEDYTFTTLQLVLDAGVYVAEVFMRKYPFIHWALSKVKGRRTVNYNLPVLQGIKFKFEPTGEPEPMEFNPTEQILTCIARYLDDGNEADHLLLNVYKIWREDAENTHP